MLARKNIALSPGMPVEFKLQVKGTHVEFVMKVGRVPVRLSFTDTDVVPDGHVALHARGVEVEFTDVKLKPLKGGAREKTSSSSKRVKTVTAGGLEIKKRKPLSGKTMWYWTNQEHHVLVVPYKNFQKELNEALESIFGMQYHFFAVGIYNELGKDTVGFNYWESLVINTKKGEVYGTIDQLDMVYDEIDEKISKLKKEKSENEHVKWRMKIDFGDAFKDEFGKRAMKQKLTSFEAIDRRNKQIDFMVNTLEKLRKLFRTLSVRPGGKEMCLMAVRSKLKMSKIDKVYLKLRSDDPQLMEPIRTSRTIMRDLGIGEKK